MSTKRRQLRKRQTRRRRVSRRKQAGGGEKEDFPIIQSIYRQIKDGPIINPAKLIAAIYTTPAMYAKTKSHPVESPIGKGVIPDQYARPIPGKNPLNSVIKGAYNFFHPHAGRYRGSDGDPAEYKMAHEMNNTLQSAFSTFMKAHPRIVMERGVEYSIPAKGAMKTADALFRQIQQIIDASARAAREVENAERRERAREAEARERERQREFEREMRTAARPAAAAGKVLGATNAGYWDKGYWDDISVATRAYENEERRAGRMPPMDISSGAYGGAGRGPAPAPRWGRPEEWVNTENMWSYP